MSKDNKSAEEMMLAEIRRTLKQKTLNQIRNILFNELELSKDEVHERIDQVIQKTITDYLGSRYAATRIDEIIQQRINKVLADYVGSRDSFGAAIKQAIKKRIEDHVETVVAQRLQFSINVIEREPVGSRKIKL
jgi:hypothetical protein